MKDYAVLTNDGKYTIFEFNNQRNTGYYGK